MRRHYSLFQKLLALVLTLVLVIGLLPNIQLSASAAIQAANRVADVSTLNEWQDYFGPNVLSTEFAGGVWTDKSVLIQPHESLPGITMDDPNNNFLISLSAIAANQQIQGHASTPLDIMLTLDVSGSMDSGNKDTAMIAAANQAIGRLLSQNNNNRVGVVLYSGNSSTNQNAGTGTATVILPLDHYTTTDTATINSNGQQQTIPVYLNLTSNRVSVSSKVRNSNGQHPGTDGKSVSGGTYIQNGLYKAWTEFSKVTDTVIPAGNPQAGARRTPIMILMSDGQPTLATANYNNVGSSNSSYGNGSEGSTDWQTVFLTQLTASWVKGKMEAHYGITPKFYTLGLGTGSSNYATAVLNPSNAYTDLNTYWNRFFNNSVNDSGNVNVGSNRNPWNLYKDSNVKVSDYVDSYYLASNASGMLDAFDSIVNDIELEAAGHVTLVDPIGEDLSGYITFTDELGVLMEVKDLKGLVLGNQLFSGHELAKSLQESSMGTQQNPTDYGNEFIRTVRERLGITNATDAQALVTAAYADGQLAYNAQTGAYSNYIGWYSNDAGDYLGFWDKDTGITAEGAPAGTTWINKSYGYLGTAGSSDMMHVVVMLSTHISSGMQVVQFKIPASLIPKVTYEVELNSDDPTDMKSLTRKDADPLRLIYEVGMRSDLNAINLEQKIAELPEELHVHKNSDGTYSFYTNLWGSEDGDHNIDYTDPLSHQVAQSHFHPAEGNSRYYYTEDTPVYVKSGNSYSLYRGTSAPSGNGFYRAYHYYTASGYTTEYLPMSTYALNMAAANGRGDDGLWYIPQGAIFQQIDRFRQEKDRDNPTGTLEYYDYPVVVRQNGKYDVYAFLGNNGKITVAPAQGIKLTKTVTETAEGAPDTFTFHVTLSQAVANPVVTDADGNAYNGNWSANGNVITVELKADETVYITGLPAGINYSVSEVESRFYSASSNNATGTVTAHHVNAVEFVNAPKGYGNLIVSKDVDHPYATVPQALTDKEFTIHVTLSGPNTANKTFAVTGSATVSSITTDAGGAFSVVLKDNESITVMDLPEDTTFVASETLDPVNHKGFYMDAERSILTGKVVKHDTVQAHVVNVYAPSEPVASIDVTGTKTLVDEGGTFDWAGKNFTIRLEQYDPATGTYTTIDETTVTEGNLTFKFEDALKLNAIGTYYYKVSEIIPADRLPGMSYDATAGRFEVRVTDNDVNGELEFEVYNVDTGDQISGSEYVYTFTKNFVNTHTTDATYVEFVVNKDVVDPHNTGTSEAGFLFELFPVENDIVSTIPAYSMRTVVVGNEGQALFHIPITKIGELKFILKEIAPLDEVKIPGMIYDDSQYWVIINTTADEESNLVPVVTFRTQDGTDVAEEDLVFTNEIDLEPLTLNPYIVKDLIGREPLSDSEFTFHVLETDGSFVTPKANGYSDTAYVGEGELTFAPVTINAVGTYYFRAWEETGTTKGMTYDHTIYHITVNVTVENGELVADSSFVRVGSGSTGGNVTFTNHYVNTDTAELVLQGMKNLTGRGLITGEFSFTLTGSNGYTETVTNRADGSFVFSPITYTADDIGTHTYTITEVNGGKGGITYDRKTCTVTVTVSDNGAGELIVTADGANSIEFNNTYSTTDATVSFSGTKNLFNTDLEEYEALQGGEFTFELYATDKNYSIEEYLVDDTTNDANGTFGFGLRYTQPGDYYYLLREKIEDAPGVGYDAGMYQIKIVVFDTGLGSLNGHIDRVVKVGTNENTIAFGNYYTPASTNLTISGEKVLLNRDLLDGEFDFKLYSANSAFSPFGLPLQTVANEGKDFTFAPITFDKSGTYYYVVKEDIPSEAIGSLYNGVGYDISVLGITVTVTDNGNGQLEATYTVTKNGEAAELRFENIYTITNPAVFGFSGSKSWIDTVSNAPKAMQGGEFTFEAYDSNGVRIATAHNDENGSFSFHDIPITSEGTHEFTVKEANLGLGGVGYDSRVYTVTVNATDNGLGGLTLSDPVFTLNGQSAELEFTNTYTVTQTTAQFRAQKILEGKDLVANQFSFGLFEVDAAGNTNLVQTMRNLAGGGIVFDEITYTEPGDYRYIIREAIPLDAVNNVKDGITYDTHECEILVSVGDNGDGTMTADVTYETLPRFVNTYAVSGQTTVNIPGHKELIGKDLEAGMFSFALYKDGQELATVTNAASGNFVFENVPLDSLGEHIFTVEEVKGDLSSITYDETVYTVTVNVTDNGIGGLRAGAPIVMLHSVAKDLKFQNRYVNTGSGSVSVGGTKVFTQDGQPKPIGENQFSFLLTGPNVSETVYAQADGTFSFSDLHYTARDIGQTYTYTVQEIIPTGAGNAYTKDGIVYDPTIHTFTVQIEDNNEGGITITKRIGQQTIADDVQVLFSNTYSIQGSGFITVDGIKTYTDGHTQVALPFSAGAFSFNLKGHGIDQTVTNKADGSFTFSPIVYTKDDVSATPYIYTVSEVKGSKDYIDYDKTLFTVEVMVKDDGKGGLDITKTIKKAGNTVNSIAFANTYNILADAVVPVSGLKNYNKPLQGGDFTFILTGHGINETAQNDKHGNFFFPTLRFTKDDVGQTFLYTVRESIPADAATQADGTYLKDGITYDPDVYTIKITVEDNGEGGLTVTKTVNEAAVNDILVVFNNYYDITCTGNLVLTGTKKLIGKTLADGAFSFGLFDTTGKPICEPVTNKDGKFTISVEFNKTQVAGSPYNYILREIIPEEAVKNADGTYTLNGITYDAKFYAVKVTVADDGMGGLDVDYTVNGGANTPIAFINTYKAAPATLVLEATKSYNKPLKGEDFSFLLEGTIGSTKVSQVKKNDKDGKILFDELNFPAAGIYSFRVTETDKVLGFIKYDKSVYNVVVTVTDNGKGQLEISDMTVNTVKDGKITFNNTYVIDGIGSVVIDGQKLYNKELAGGEFAFNLSGHGISETVKNDKDGKFTFSALTYDKDDVGNTYFYTISEVKGNENYITYDRTLYTVVVAIADDGEGGLDITKTIKKNGADVDAITFSNTYNVISGASVPVSGIKLYNKELLGGDFSFRLFGHNVDETVQNDKNGNFFFTDLRYTKADIGKTFTYIVREVIPADAVKQADGTYLKDGITYDPDVYTIKITVEDNGEGGLTVIKSVNAVIVNDIQAVFNNRYDIVCTGKLALSGTKTLTGKTLKDGEFSFGLYDAAGKLATDAVTNKGGKFTISLEFNKTQITGSPFVYTLKEIVPDGAIQNKDGTYTLNGITYDSTVYTVKVVVADNGKGGLDVDYTVNGSADTPIVFTNTYKAAPAALVLEATKSYNKPLKGEDFSFLLEGTIGSTKVSQVKKNDKDGKILFDELTFSEAGIYSFRVTETDKVLGFIEYDKSVYDVLITVTDNGIGQLEISNLTVNTVKDGQITFNNTYVIDGVGSVVIDGQKLYNKELVGGEFAFNLSGHGINETVKNGKDGKFTFSALTYDADDVGNTYTYTVSEVKGDKDYITYDETLYTVIVTVADDEEGGLKITKAINKAEEAVEAITFTNTYAVIGTGYAEISGQKLYNKDLTGGEFAFNLSGNGINETVANTAEGKFTFSRIRFTKDDIGNTYTYIVSEVKGDKDYITYDDALFTVEVTVADNGEGGLTVKQSYKKGNVATDAITFTNTYTNIGTGSVSVGGIKRYNKELTGNDFTFILSQILADGTKQLEEVKNAADGTFSFTALAYTSADIGSTYTYAVQEAIPADAVKQADGTYLKDGITYDPDVYTVTVTVEDNNEGGLKITKKLGITEVDEIVVEFNNAYDITGTGKLELTGTKELTGGKPLADGDFSFGLYDAKGNLVAEPVANAEGKFTFTVEYDKSSISADPIVYTVKEIIPAGATQNSDGTYTLDHITYDATVYQVEVTVSDNGKGGIDVASTLVNADAIAFTNVYTPANHIVNLNVQKHIVNKAEDSITAEGFQFELYYQELLLATYSSSAEGLATFPVAFTAKDIGSTFTFQIKEVNTQLTGVTYDTTVHEITVTIGQNEDGTINSRINDELSDTITVEFTNTYAKPVTPSTGDSSNLALLFVLLLVSGTGLVTIIADRKRRRA